MKIDTHKLDGVNRLKLPGKVTLTSEVGTSLQEIFDDLLAAGERAFVFDMMETRYVDSAGLGAIVACYKKATGLGGTVKLIVDQRSSTRELLALTHLDKVLDVSSDPSDEQADH